MTTRKFEAVLGVAGYRLCQRAFRAATLTYAGLSLLHEVRLLPPLFDFHASLGERQGSTSNEV